MKKRAIVGLIAILIILGSLIVWELSITLQNKNMSLSTGGQQAFSSGDLITVSQNAEYNIAISNYQFTPSQMIIRTGDTVIWTNNDNVEHTVTSNSGNELGSSTLSSGETYPHTFSAPGTYDYHCSNYPSMMGEVIVT